MLTLQQLPGGAHQRARSVLVVEPSSGQEVVQLLRLLSPGPRLSSLWAMRSTQPNLNKSAKKTPHVGLTFYAAKTTTSGPSVRVGCPSHNSKVQFSGSQTVHRSSRSHVLNTVKDRINATIPMLRVGSLRPVNQKVPQRDPLLVFCTAQNSGRQI